jgi:hypothetical protein
MRVRTSWASASVVILAGCLGSNPNLNQPGSNGNNPAVDPGVVDPGGGSGGGGGGEGGPAGGGPTTPTTPTTPAADPDLTDRDPFKGLPTGSAQRAALCARGNGDRLATSFCAATPPSLTSIKELQAMLGLSFAAPNGNNAQGGNPGFALTGHSSSLVARFVSAINPRAIVFTPSPRPNNINNPRPNPGFVAMGFARGEQFAEIAAHDTTKGDINFYLVHFQQACNSRPGGCSNGELLTPTVEKDWTSVTIYQDVDLKNTIFDCTHCHQPGGPSTKRILRMQERVNPWTHWFRNNRTGGQALLADFHAAHGTTEDYGPIPAAMIDKSDPAQLEGLVENNSVAPQPNEFPSDDIEQEVEDSSPMQPQDNSTPGTSATWQALYDRVVAGQFIPVPYHDVKVTDATKLAAATASYRAVMAGMSPLGSLMDIREVFLDAALPKLSFRPKAGISGKQILEHMCQRCHNPSLDQTISRAKFDVTKLATMPRAEKDLAIKRLTLPMDTRLRMPPPRFGELSPAEIQLVIDELRK